MDPRDEPDPLSDPLSSDAFGYGQMVGKWSATEPVLDDMKTIDLSNDAPARELPLKMEMVATQEAGPSVAQHTVQLPTPIITTRLQYTMQSTPLDSGAGPSSSSSSSTLPSLPVSSMQMSLRPSLRSSPLIIKATDPIKKEQTGIFGLSSSYTSYLVTSQPSISPLSQAKVVRRRFKDFVQLSDVLKATFRGYFLPPRPEKNAVDGQNEAFVEERRSSLESYLRQLAGHPDIATSEVLAVFLNEPRDLSDSPQWWSLIPLHIQQQAAGGGGGLILEGTTKFAKQLMGQEKKVLDPVQAAQPTRSMMDPYRAMKETAQSIQSKPSGSSTPNGVRSPDEAALLRALSSYEGHKDALLAASKAAEQLVQAMDARALVDGDLGLALHKLSGYEEAHGSTLAQYTGTIRQHQSIVASEQSSSSALIKAARVGRTATGKVASELSSLHDYLALMPNVAKGLKHREKQLLTADTLEADLARTNRSISDLEVANAKVLGGDPVRQRKMEELRGEAAKLEQSILAASAEYEKIKAVNFKEIARLQGDMRQDLGHMLRQIAAGQAASAGRSLEVWLQAASELGADESELEGIRRLAQS